MTQDFTPTLERSINRGSQKVYRFSNGYGASVVCHIFSYGGASGLSELAVIKFNSDNALDFELDYSTPITGDVLGHLNDSEVNKALLAIAALPPVINTEV